MPARKIQVRLKAAGEGRAGPARGPSAAVLFATVLAAVLVAGAQPGTTATAAAGKPWQGGNFVVTGSVSLPDGNPAARTTVKISGQTGLNMETTTDSSGRYQFQVPGGRYRLSAVNPQNPEQYIDNIEADTSRTAGNRLVVNLYLRTAPAKTAVSSGPGVVSASEASQQIPKEARKAYDDGLKLRGRNQIEKALASFDRAIELYPDYVQALSERGELRITKNQIEPALGDFERALQV